jgi:hypothetical protein
MLGMYLFYIDESGQREYGKTSRYFSLCGLGVPVQSWQLLNAQFNTLKQAYFGTPVIEIKSAWVRQPEDRREHYLKPYGITEVSFHEFMERLYETWDHPELVLMAAVVDKVQMQSLYVDPQSPSSLAYRLLFERFQQALEAKGDSTFGLVIFDKINEAGFVKKGYENLLARQHLRYLVQGTDYVAVNNIVEGLLFIPSSENNFVQLADLCAYNVFRQFKDYGKEWDAPTRDEWLLYPYFARIIRRFYVGPNQLLAGYGIKKFPDYRKLEMPKVNWRVSGEDISGWVVTRK